MAWFPYVILFLALLLIWYMPKHLSKVEIYVTWFVIALINLSVDIVLSFVFNLYELGEEGIQLSVHIIELSLGSAHGIIFLNFMPQKRKRFLSYFLFWLIYSVLLEAGLVHFKFIHYSGWKLWYSFIFYSLALLYTRWHLFFIRSGK
ncbi:MAG TPA: hypothetical protein VNR61_17955 [Niallia sp.]|nr:hypothetical protein [Niallia sp.]